MGQCLYPELDIGNEQPPRAPKIDHGHKPRDVFYCSLSPDSFWILLRKSGITLTSGLSNGLVEIGALDRIGNPSSQQSGY